MTYIKINETLYPATISGRLSDKDWDNRESKAITLEMDYGTAINLFVDGLSWGIVEVNIVRPFRHDESGQIIVENGQPVFGDPVEQTEEYDNSDYCVAGDLTDHRDGTVTVKMGKLTELEEAYEIMLGGI